MPGSKFKIDPAKDFPTLPHAPIVEAVLHWQAAATVQFNETQLADQLKAAFPDYQVGQQHNLETAFRKTEKGAEFKQTANWDGVRLTKRENERPVFVCQFKADGLVFSRLAPYLDWPNFEGESRRFWEKFVELGKPVEIARLSCRYISQIQIDEIGEVGEYLDVGNGPLAKVGVSPEHFFHQDTVNLVDPPYTINLITAVQPNSHPTNNQLFLIVDIDISANEAITDFTSVPTTMKDLRFIKNQVFFSLMNDAEKKFGADKQ